MTGDGETRIVARGFSFANGIALSSDGRSLFVNETGRYRLWKIDGRANDLDVQSGSPQARVLLDNLPGYPDNLMRGRDGRIWVGLFKPRNPAADSLAERPFLRKVMLRLPRSLLPLGNSYGHVFAIDEDGRVTDSLQDPSGAYPEATGATETADRLYIHSLHAHGIGWLRDAALTIRPERAMKTSSETLIHYPVERINLARWISTMTDGDYQACSRAHRAAGTFRRRESRDGQCQSVGGNLLVQHYRATKLTADHVVMHSKNSRAYISHLFPATVEVIWTLEAEPKDAQSSLFRLG